ncbi:MAG: hypothetical protein MJZ89_05345 [Paludibacteraceae bacterium]|nr:hypothetical protein [Paludibacteraceae bacterium]
MSSLLMSHAEQLVVTVESYNSAVVAGDVPDGLQVRYQQVQETHRKSQLTAGEQAILQIDGIGQIMPDSVKLMMHSNTSSGAGSMTMTIDGRTVWSIENQWFDEDGWYGNYSREYVPIVHELHEAGDLLEMVITSTENSLYFQQLTLYYSPAPREAYTVHFDCYDPLQVFHAMTESAPGAGIVLPGFSSPNNQWVALGWTSHPMPENTDELPEYVAPHTIYYPHENCRLYALYAHSEAVYQVAQMERYDAEMEGDREYVIAAGQPYNVMASSAVMNQKIACEKCDIESADNSYLSLPYVPIQARYHIQTAGDSMLIKHMQSDTYVGYRHSASTNYLTDKPTCWRWVEGAHHSLWLYHDKGAEYAHFLFPTFVSQTQPDSIEMADCRYLWQSTMGEGLLLFDVTEIPHQPQEAIYTTHPTGTELPEVNAVLHDSVDWTQEISVYSTDGRKVANGVGNKLNLPPGLWIICQDNTKKMLFLKKK